MFSQYLDQFRSVFCQNNVSYLTSPSQILTRDTSDFLSDFKHLLDPPNNKGELC